MAETSNPKQSSKDCSSCPLLERSVTLRDLFEARLLSIEKSIEATKHATELRMESMNDFRRQIEKERQDYIPRKEYRALEKSVDEVRLSLANTSGKASMMSVYAAIILGIVSLLSSLAAWIQFVVVSKGG